MLKPGLVLFSLSMSFSILAWAEDLHDLQIAAGETISRQSNSNEAFEAGTVRLEAQSVLELSDFRSLRIQHLIAEEGARIRLAANANGGHGGHGQAGSDGENVRFFLGKIEGHIVIEARGGNGGDGLDGAHGRQGADGLKGRDGRTVLFGLIYVGDGDAGQPGSPGEPGQDGESGGAGGNGGHVALFYREKTPGSKIFIDVNGGRGGKGGRGGIGGLGGNGGVGGRGVRRGAQGPMGSSGKSGKPGFSARSGRPGEAVVYQLDPELFQCLYRLDLLSSVQTLSTEDFDSCKSDQTSHLLPAPLVFASSVRKTSSEKSYITMAFSADGLSGDDASNALQAGTTPPAGADGAHGGEMTLLVRDLPEAIQLSARGGNGGRGGNGAIGTRGLDGMNGRNEGLFHKATAGTDGQDGGNGGDGSDGGNGASGGHIRVVYVHAFDQGFETDWISHFEYDLAGGSGGLQGMGGVGGRGGQAGLGGKKWNGKYEANGRPGLTGQNGRAGRQGSAGEDGTIEFFETESYQAWVISEYQRYLDNDRRVSEK